MITKDSIQTHFPALRDRHYLNTAAESIPPLSVKEALLEFWEHKSLGMDGRDHHFAREKTARTHAARLLGLQPSEIAFCSCSSEAYNLLASALGLRENDEVIISDLDFPSGATPWLVGRNKPQTLVWKARGGVLELEDLKRLLSPRTRLVQVSLVSFYNGWRLPWQSFIEMVRKVSPGAIVSVDLTQALGRCELDCPGADIVISSTHKWILGIHGGCVVGIPKGSANRLTSTAGGWYHLLDPFGENRFESAEIKPGAASFSVGMPSFAPIYALNAAMEFLLAVGIENICAHADPLVKEIHAGLTERGIAPLAPYSESGIVAFRHPDSPRIENGLRQRAVHVMHHAGRLRIAVHGYNTADDIRAFFDAFDAAVKES